MTDTVASTPENAAPDSGNSRIEFLAVLLLGLAGLLTAYAAYKGGLAGGDAIKGYSEATISRNEANGYYNDHMAQANQDMGAFMEYWSLQSQGQTDVAEEIRYRTFSPGLEAAFAEWETVADDGSNWSPLQMDSYTTESLAKYAEFYDQSVAEFDAAAEIDDKGDKIEMAGVFFAVSLFFAGIATVFRSSRFALALLIFAGALQIPGIWAMLDSGLKFGLKN